MQLRVPGIKIKVMFGPKLLNELLLENSDRLEVQNLNQNDQYENKMRDFLTLVCAALVEGQTKDHI